MTDGLAIFMLALLAWYIIRQGIRAGFAFWGLFGTWAFFAALVGVIQQW